MATAPSFIRFRIANQTALRRLETVAAALADAKEHGLSRHPADWRTFFSADDLATFWWPDASERSAWDAFWISTPVARRIGPAMPLPPWDFASMIDALLKGEYQLAGVQPRPGSEADFNFAPSSFPYGGADAMRALVRCFGHTIIGFDDGTGYVTGDPQPPRWMPPRA